MHYRTTDRVTNISHFGTVITRWLQRNGCAGPSRPSRPGPVYCRNGTRIRRMNAPQALHPHDHRHCIDDALTRADTVCAERGARMTPLRRRVLELVWDSHAPIGAYAI